MKNSDERRPILAIETSQGTCDTAVYFGDDKIYSMSVRLKNSHAEVLFEAVENVLNLARTETGQLDHIAVSSGPGSFTGLRIGMSAAKGLAMGSGTAICPVPTFEALALQICSFSGPGEEFIIANSVNSEEVYYAKFQILSNNYIFADDLTILKNAELAERKGSTPVYGNCIYSDFPLINAPSAEFIGRWAAKYGAELKTTGFDLLEPNYLKSFIIRGKTK